MTYYYCNAALCISAVVPILFLSTNFVNLSPIYAQTIAGDLYAIAELRSESVVPPASAALDSNASGSFELDDNFVKKLDYQINLTIIGDITSAHIHSGNEGQNGPIVVTLIRNDSKLEPITTFNGNVTNGNLEGPLADKNLFDFIELILNGWTYVDVHTKQNPNGEIRGQIHEINNTRTD